MNHAIVPYLETKERCLPLLHYFLESSIEDVKSEVSDASSPLSYLVFYKKFLPAISLLNIDNIYTYSESPIERIFLASLQLLFIKNNMPCLHISAPVKNAVLYMNYYRQTHNGINKMIEHYKTITGDHELTDFEAALARKQANGEFTEEDVTEIKLHQTIVPNFAWNSYHLIPQAGLPDIKVNGRSIRCDLLIWVPGDDRVKIVVECDGFAYHNSKESFRDDRARDRALQLNGFRIIRFTGADINEDPIKVSNDLFDLLAVIDEDIDKKRVL